MSDVDWGLGSVIWAKTNMRDVTDTKWSSLAQHSMDTALVASLVWDAFLPMSVKTRIVTGFNNHFDTAKTVIMFLAGCHDVGKATPVFERQASGPTGEKRLNELESHGLTIPANIGEERLRHEISGYWAMVEWLESNGVNKEQSEKLAITIGGHHGTFWGDKKSLGSSYSLYSDRNKNNRFIKLCYGSGEWSKARYDVISAVSRIVLGDDVDFSSWNRFNIDLGIQTLITGIITMSDWMASDSWPTKFPLTADGLVSMPQERNRVHNAWSLFSLPKPYRWDYSDTPFKDFAYRFSLPEKSNPNALQDSVMNVVNDMHGNGGMLIIEAPMGGGKTEAALLASEKLGSANGCGGLAFSLPTQATADGVLVRVATWASRSTNDTNSLKLIHGNAWMNQDYNEIRNGSMHDTDRNVGLVANPWLDNHQTGLLSNFVISTIDQILMMSLQSKHFDLKHLGLAGKVIIIDEVHAADDYMLSYLERALEWLGSYHAPVIILSATLPSDKRKRLALAYKRGMLDYKTITNEKTSMNTISGEEEYAESYPLITVVESGSAKMLPIEGCQNEQSKQVKVIKGSISDLEHVLSDGGNALIVRNSVKRAQETYLELKDDDRFSDWDINLLHARFVSTDRSIKEGLIRHWYGREATTENGGRPHNSITVTTQVAEQSLDVDFDVLMTDICPVDLLLQRIGRIHRHAVHDESRPAPLRTPIVIIDGWDKKKDSIKIDYGSSMIYGKSKLLRAIALTGFEQGTTITIPRDVSPLVQTAYSDSTRFLKSKYINDSQIDDEFIRQLKIADDNELNEIEAQRKKASVFQLRSPHQMKAEQSNGLALLGVKELGKYDILWGANDRDSTLRSEEELKAQVRDSSMGIKCILMIQDGDHAVFLDYLENGPLHEHYPEVPFWGVDEETGMAIMSQMVTLPPELSNDRMILPTLNWMEKHGYIDGWQDNRYLKDELVLLLDKTGNRRIEIPVENGVKTFDLSYTSQMGLTVSRVNAD